MGRADETLATAYDGLVKKPEEPPTVPLLGHDSLTESNGNENASKDGSSSLPKPSETISRTIQELERLLAEAVKLAEAAGAMKQDVETQETVLARPSDASRRTSEDLAKRMNKHLEAAATEPTNTPVRKGAARPLKRRETGIGPTDVETPDNASPLDGTLRLLPRDPTAEIVDERKGGLSKDRGRSGEESTAHKKKSVTIVEPPGTNRRNSPSEVPRGKRKHNQSLERPRPCPVPALQLNDVDMNDVNPEEKDGMLSSPGMLEVPRPGHERHFTQMFGISSRQGSMLMAHADEGRVCKIDLNGARHIDVAEKPDDFDVHKTCHHAPVARNWPDSRKRFAALISCINTACLGLIIGIYAGEVPAIQYVVVDLNREMILGNVFLYCGLVLPTLACWPLPLLHGRKPYTVFALAVALCLQIPQGLMVISFRSPDIARYRVILLLARGLSGFIFGFANMNNLGTLLDVFGASLSSSKAHEDLASPFDVRRHGGGMGVCIGFVIGAFIISGTSVDWGFWVSLLLLMGVLLLNFIAPEVRRSAFRRTLAEIIGEGGSFSRVARGEIKLHLTGTGPYWWGEEVKAGLQLSWRMVQQPGFLILSIYAAWVYAQFTLILMLLGALTSTLYQYRPDYVGLCVLSLAIGSALAIPFQKASWLSRARYQPPRTDSMTYQKVTLWSSHTIRRTLAMVFLPLAAIGYALTSKGPAFLVVVPCVFAGLVGYATTLAISECYALIMETFDTSDLQPGMTGRPVRKSIVERYRETRTNFSCHPRVSAGMAVTQSMKFAFGAVSTAICGSVERRYGAMHAAGIVAGVLLLFTLLLTAVLVRWKSVQMIPSRKGRHVDNGDDPDWEPVVLGSPSGLTRKISILEAGKQTRWCEIRRRNRLEAQLTGG